MEERTWWRGQNESQTGGEEKRNDRLVGAAETSKELAEWRRLQRRNLSILGLPKRKEWSQRHRESSWQVRRSRPYQKEKEQSRQSKALNHEGGESRTLTSERGIRARAWSGKGGLHRERRFGDFERVDGNKQQRLCCKLGKQDISRNSRNFGKI